MRRWVYRLVVVVFVIALLSPWLCGVLLQHKYHAYIALLNQSNGSVSATIVDYHRGWHSSDATLDIKVNHLWGSAEHYEFVVEQQIEHGPIVFKPFAIALGMIHNNIHFTKDTTALLAKQGISESILSATDSVILFNGDHINYFKLNNLKFQIALPTGLENIAVSGADGYIWVNQNQKSMGCDIALHNLRVKDLENSLAISEMKLKLNQFKNHHGIWLGNDELALSKLILHLSDDNNVTATGVNLSGDLNELSGELSGFRKIDIDQVSFLNRTFGPVHMELSGEKLSLATLRSMLTTYQEVTQNGEMYPSQLRYRLFALLPNVIMAGSNIKIDKLDVVSPKGNLHLSGVLSWPTKDFIAPDTVSEMSDSAEMRIEMTVAKPLVNDAINYVSNMPDFIRDASAEDRPVLIDLRNSLELSVRQNVFMISQFEHDEIISSSAADELLALQDKFVSEDNYTAAVSKLFWQKQITLAASYWLNWQYAQIQKPYQTLMQKLSDYKDVVKKNLQDQIQELISEHYLRESNDVYSLSVIWSNGKLKLNGTEW